MFTLQSYCGSHWQWGPILEIIFITNYEAKTENPMKIAAL